LTLNKLWQKIIFHKIFATILFKLAKVRNLNKKSKFKKSRLEADRLLLKAALNFPHP